MARAVIAIVDPQAMLSDQSNGYLPDDIRVDMGEDPNTTVITGERDAVFRFLTDDMGVDADEANEYIDREEDNAMNEHDDTVECDKCGATVPRDQAVEVLDPDGMLCPSCAAEEEEEILGRSKDALRDYYTDMAIDRRRMGEGAEKGPTSVAEFDKFMDRILVEEGNNKPQVKQEDSPQRRRAALHQDRPLNKIRFGGK